MEFSFRTRARDLNRMSQETYDLLVVGGGITGAAVARDAVTRGLKVALVERQDFAFGTSSRSSKLIHGGFRYLESMKFFLVFEALCERALLLRTTPHMVRPVPFFLPVYSGGKFGKNMYDLGLWLYDLLALFRTPGFHRRLSKGQMLKLFPGLETERLEGGFRYFDASMWDDVLVLEILRDASAKGALIASYASADQPLFEGDRLVGFEVVDQLSGDESKRVSVHARKVVLCTGPWADEMGTQIDSNWRSWLKPSKGVHLVFDANRLKIPGALVMAHPDDGRISFAVPRPDYGSGVVIVGTTDGPTHPDPARAEVVRADIDYLMGLLRRYLPDQKLEESDILSTYVGVRPLVDDATSGSADGADSSASLQKVSREHKIDHGPGRSVLVAGGKYTTHRTMAEEIVDFALKSWGEDARKFGVPGLPESLVPPDTEVAINPKATIEGRKAAQEWARMNQREIPADLLDRYGSEAIEILKIQDELLSKKATSSEKTDPEGFSCLEAQLRYSVQTLMVVKLWDFYMRRVPLYYARRDHGMPWAELLAKALVEELGLDLGTPEGERRVQKELEELRREVELAETWRSSKAVGS